MSGEGWYLFSCKSGKSKGSTCGSQPVLMADHYQTSEYVCQDCWQTFQKGWSGLRQVLCFACDKPVGWLINHPGDYGIGFCAKDLPGDMRQEMKVLAKATESKAEEGYYRQLDNAGQA